MKEEVRKGGGGGGEDEEKAEKNEKQNKVSFMFRKSKQEVEEARHIEILEEI